MPTPIEKEREEERETRKSNKDLQGPAHIASQVPNPKRTERGKLMTRG